MAQYYKYQAWTGGAVIVTGGNSGIGYAIARSFVKANAARVIILGRRKDVVASAAAKLQEEGYQFGSGTDVQGRTCDISDLKSTEHLWKALVAEGTFVDVLVLSAASYAATETILDGGLSKVWGDFEPNVRSILDITERVYKIKAADPGLASPSFQALLCSHFYPGGILTDSVKRSGGDRLKDLVFDDESLPGHFSVWTATPEAIFLYGRSIWAN
ncbi:hypothetical protein LB505_012280 [Fusarium chuoi]|nr:hypothetical protein LB505_012280 [Fusarium chuoi]